VNLGQQEQDSIPRLSSIPTYLLSGTGKRKKRVLLIERISRTFASTDYCWQDLGEGNMKTVMQAMMGLRSTVCACLLACVLLPICAVEAGNLL
jgi:hypothetical protein